MNLVKKILNKLNGLHYPQEYLCISKESFQHPLHVYLAEGRRILEDITNKHLFTGYCPLIFALNSSPIDRRNLPDKIDIIFSQHSRQPNEILEKKDAIALLSLQLIRRQSAGDNEIVYYEGIKGKHRFLSLFHQHIISLNNRLYNKKPGNVFLHNNLYKQVQIAYAVPRTISLITVSDGNLFNLFPTDLHGPVNDQYYVSSLRHEGKACKQVEHAGRVVISQMHCDIYKSVYALGKNHMQDLETKDDFPFGVSSSLIFQLPLPQSALCYRELELLESFEHGIHKLLLYKILSSQIIRDQQATLAHVHNVYATWRHNKGLAGNYLLR
jgi:flavin reductase (DIM6/NTAB) family NADH-FMN oxidoreductase RutF